MSEKKSIKRIAILLLILANIAVIIALGVSVISAVDKIEIGKEVDMSQGEQGAEGQDEDINLDQDNQNVVLDEPTENPTDEPAEEPDGEQTDENNNETINKDKTEEEKIGLKEILGQLGNQPISIIEIVLVFVGIGLFIMGAVLLRIAKRLN